jgi:putative endonuclease
LAWLLLIRSHVTHARIALGKTGEDLAVRELERRGYAIIARRWRSRRGEIDVIARDGATLVFVEVKARDGEEFGDGAEAITIAKQRRLAQLAAEYLARRGSADCACRFDVVAIRLNEGRPDVEVFQNAFDAD